MCEGDAHAEERFKQSANLGLRDLLQRIGLPGTAQLYTVMRPEVRHILAPASGCGTRAIEKLEARGFRGNCWPPGVEDQVVFRDWDVLVAGIASIILDLPTDLRAFIRDQRTTPGFESRI